MFNPFGINFNFGAFDYIRSTYSFDLHFDGRYATNKSKEPYITIQVPRKDKHSELGRRRIEMLKSEAIDVEFIEVENQ